MILGIGIDVTKIDRIEKTIARFGQRFLDRIFTEYEQNLANERAGRKSAAAEYAKRFAAKEACSKALGTGFRQLVFWRDIEVYRKPSGQPMIRLTGGANKRAVKLTPAGFKYRIDVSLTDDYPIAEAMVILSADPENP